MGTKVGDLPGIAGVECPKKTGEMDKDESCRECRYFVRCMRTLRGVLEAGA